MEVFLEVNHWQFDQIRNVVIKYFIYSFKEQMSKQENPEKDE